jgi:hypothetical protein
VLIAVLTLGLGACAATSDLTAQRSVSADPAGVALWDPCAQVSPDLLRRIGVDPDTRTSTATEQPGWKYCTWHSSKAVWAYTIGIGSTTHPLDIIAKTKPSAVETTVGGYAGIRSRSGERECEINLAVSSGTVYVEASDTPASRDRPDPCARALAAAELLVPSLP